MPEHGWDHKRLRFVAAQIGDVVGAAQRDAAEAIAAALCTDPEFSDRHGNREGGCRRLAATAYQLAQAEVDAILENHQLVEHREEVHDDAISMVAHGILGVHEEFEDVEDEWAVADAIRRDGFGTAEALEESLQIAFDVETDDAVLIENARKNNAEIQAALNRRNAPGGSTSRGSQAVQHDNSIRAKIGRRRDSGVGGIFR